MDSSPANYDAGASLPGAHRLRIVGVDPELRFSGGETQVLGLTLELLRRGHQAGLLCDPAGLLWDRARAAEVRCSPLTIRNALDVRAGLRLRRLLRGERYDVVHFHTSRAHALAPYVRGLAGALVVTRRMDYRPNRLFAPWLYNRVVDRVAAISTGVADALVAGGVDRERITVIPSGIDTERFRPPSEPERTAARAAWGLGPGEIAIGSVGALEPRKGHRYLLAALGILGGGGGRRAVNDLRCFLAGAGSELAALRARADRLGPGGKVRFVGGLDDPRELLWALDIFVLPSLREGLGVALLEAMATGLPVIASSVGGAREVVDHGRTGLLVEPAQASGLARAIERLAAMAEVRAAMGMAGRERAVRYFGISTGAEQVLKLYLNCLSGLAKG